MECQAGFGECCGNVRDEARGEQEGKRGKGSLSMKVLSKGFKVLGKEEVWWRWGEGAGFSGEIFLVRALVDSWTTYL